MNDMSTATMETAGCFATGMTKLGADARTFVPAPPPHAHLWTVNGLVEIVDDVAVFPDGTPMDIDHAYGPMPRPRFGSPRKPEHDNAPMEWMPFRRWQQCYGFSTVEPYYRMGMEQARACWTETCNNADKVKRCRQNADSELEVLLSNRWIGVTLTEL